MQSPPSNVFQEQLRQDPRLALIICLLLYLISSAVLVPGLLAMIQLAYGLSGEGMQHLLSGDFSVHAQSRGIFRMAQTGHQLLTWGLLALLMAFLLGKGKEQLSWRAPWNPWQYPLAVVLIVVSIPLAQFLFLSVENLAFPDAIAHWKPDMLRQERQSHAILKSILQSDQLGLNLFVFALVPALCEEFFFRGILQRKLGELMTESLAIFLTALLFSLVHFQFSGFFSRLFLGFLLGWLLWRSGSIFLSILAHFVFNALSVVFNWWIAVSDASWAAWEQSGGGVSWYWALFSALAVAACMYVFFRLPVSFVNPSS